MDWPLSLTPRRRIEYVFGDCGYYAEIEEVKERSDAMQDVFGRWHRVPVMSGYRSVKHYAVYLGDWDVTQQFYFQAFEDRSRFIERKLTSAEFNMLAFLNFPEMTEEELDHLVWAADEYEIPLVPEKRDYLLIAAKLSQD